MTHHIAGNIHLRHKRLPTAVYLPDGSASEGFTRYKKGQGCPAELADNPMLLVELMIRTAKGAGSSGYRRGWLIDWDQGEGGMGEIVGFRIVKAGE
jgi:hypothetical protein